MIKIKLHSVTDLITNSSTVIFTYSGGTIQPLKDMINEILKTFNIDKTCDELFDAVILNDDSDTYSEWIEECNNGKYPKGVDENTDIEKLWNDVLAGKVPKPDWFKEVEESEMRCEYYTPSTFLYLIPKEEQYRKIGNLIKTFLYSTDHEATRDG